MGRVKLWLAACAALLTLIAAPAIAQAQTFAVASTADVAAADPTTGCATSAASAAHGACTLRSAVQAADAAASDSTITVPAGTYTLTIPSDGAQDDATNGDLNVSTSNGEKVTIQGAGASSTIIDANQLDRAFNATTPFELDGVTVENGNPGQVAPAGACTANPITVEPGGGVLAKETLVLTGDVFTGNLALGGGGGVAADNFTPQTITISDSVFSDNQACPSSSENPVDGSAAGGGLYVLEGDTLSIDRSRFDGNQAQSAGGGIAAAPRLFAASEPLPATGATRSFVSERLFAVRPVAPAFAGVIRDTTISHNAGVYGGGIAHASLSGDSWQMIADTIDHNTAGSGDGGGIAEGGTTDTVVNSTITGNSANDGGGIYGQSSESEIASGPTTLSFDTVTANSATGASATGNLSAEVSAGFALDDTIVAGGTGGPDGKGGAGAADCGGAGMFTSNGHNLFDASGQCGDVASDLTSAHPGVQALADNGGPTQTQALALGSPAVDAADPSLCPSETASVDQRGDARPSGRACDIGAYELQQVPDLGLTAAAAKPSITSGDADTITDTVTNHGTAAATGVTFTDPAQGGYTITSVTASQGSCIHTATTVSCSLGTLGAGASATVAVGLSSTSPGTITLTSHVGMNQPDATPNDDSATASISVLAPTPAPTPTPTPSPVPSPPGTRPSSPRADLAVRETIAPRRVIVGHTARFTVTVTNRGPSPAPGTRLVLGVPGGTAIVAAPSGCRGSRTLHCALGTLLSHHRRTLVLRVRGTHAGVQPSTAAVTARPPDPNLRNNHAGARLRVVAVPMCRVPVFHDRLDADDWVVAVRVYVDGRLRGVAHGKNLRTFALRSPAGTRSFTVRLEFVQDDRRIGVATQTFHGCAGGPIQWHLVSPPGSLNEP
ncbi:MAG TPA: DUF11 domain-containing protein [Solirubrobacteraceae bacterium]|nr:DUF11 domain-containing protein [Solirubrobacteraceae bacterium]